MSWEQLLSEEKNIVFLGESGSGKSELAINLAIHLRLGTENVHFMDLDQTKPLFRARDAQAALTRARISVHYEAQMADAPTQVGGIVPLLLNPSAHVVMDVGGGDIGSRLIGGFSHLLKNADTAVFFVVNVYRPWSETILAIDQTLSVTLSAARLKNVRFIANPYLGTETTEEEFMEGLSKTIHLLSPYVPVEAAAVPAWLYNSVYSEVTVPLLPITPYLNYL